MNRTIASIIGVLLLPLSLHAQVISDLDESKLYAESKQVNQFFRRFNGEEDEKGNRYYPNDKQYRSEKLRKKYLRILFDESNAGMSSSTKTDFVKDVLDHPKTSFLDFHGENWFAEVSAVFAYNGKEQPITLYMELEKNHLGYKWVIRKVYAEMFNPYFQRDTVRIGRFLHPLSHELDFMNLRKAFVTNDSIAQYAAKQFVPDHLSVFLYEMKKGNLKFKFVREVRFHFFQIDGWYFELADFNRSGYNTGWLISNLVKLPQERDRDVLRRHLYHEPY